MGVTLLSQPSLHLGDDTLKSSHCINEEKQNGLIELH